MIGYKNMGLKSGSYFGATWFKDNKSIEVKPNGEAVRVVKSRWNLLVGIGRRHKKEMGKYLHNQRVKSIKEISSRLEVMVDKSSEGKLTREFGQKMLFFSAKNLRHDKLEDIRTRASAKLTRNLATFYSLKQAERIEKSDFFVTLYQGISYINSYKSLVYFNEMIKDSLNQNMLSGNKYDILRGQLLDVTINKTYMQVNIVEYLPDDYDNTKKNIYELVNYLTFLENNISKSGKKILLHLNAQVAERLESVSERFVSITNEKLIAINTGTVTDTDFILEEIYSSLNFILDLLSKDKLKIILRTPLKPIFNELCLELSNQIIDNKDYFLKNTTIINGIMDMNKKLMAFKENNLQFNEYIDIKETVESSGYEKKSEEIAEQEEKAQADQKAQDEQEEQDARIQQAVIRTADTFADALIHNWSNKRVDLY